jgi:peptidyl-prolyl cis-trans isomerase C
MKRFFYSVILLSFTAALLTGCLESDKSDSPAIATVNKEAITQEDFLKEVGRVPEWARAQFEGREGKDKFLDEIIKRELIYQNALKMKLNNDKEYTAKVEEFEKMTLIALVLQKEVEEKAAVSEAETKAFFDKNEEKFRIGTEIKASHILVETEDEAKDILDKINKGEEFAKLAKEHSKDKGSAEKGGDLGYFGRGKMVPEFERAVMSLKPGEVSAPVKTRFGFHVIKLTDIKEGDPANFEQSKGSIQKQLITQKRKKLFDSYIESLKSAGNIEKDQEMLMAITLPWEDAAAPALAPAPEPAPAE